MIISLRDSEGVDRLYVTDASGSEPRLLEIECDRQCGDYGFSFSPDGTRLAFVRLLQADNNDEESVIAILDMTSGAVVELDSTHVLNPYLDGPCGYFCGPGVNSAPSWSPDGSQLVFSRVSVGTGGEPQGIGEKDLYVVDADGGNVTRLDPSEPAALTAIGCISCPYPGVSGVITYPSVAYWTPAP